MTIIKDVNVLYARHKASLGFKQRVARELRVMKGRVVYRLRFCR